ncbi:IS110 family transposase [Streptomyces sp. NPDC047009]|uniref:IS110 family transposase n=1 Tax=unclassified Streptomyces TaxID=2593676 RepID=UPI003404B0A7
MWWPGWPGLPQPAAVAYEAGANGFVLARALEAAGIRCVVAAPSKMERPARERIKTDRRDAQRLDELPAVHVPDQVQEAARDLVRSRDDVRRDLTRSRHRVSKLLLRQGRVYCGGTGWTRQHHRWLTAQRFPDPDTQFAFDQALEQVLALEALRGRFDRRIADAAARPQWWPVVRRLSCLRGIDTLSAFGLAAEIGDWHRFAGATIGAYLGLVPSDHSSGASRSQGPITKTGNTHVRRLLIVAAWHHYQPYRYPSAALRRRMERAPAPVFARGPRQPAAAPTMGELPCPQEEHERYRRGCRP